MDIQNLGNVLGKDQLAKTIINIFKTEIDHLKIIRYQKILMMSLLLYLFQKLDILISNQWIHHHISMLMN